MSTDKSSELDNFKADQLPEIGLTVLELKRKNKELTDKVEQMEKSARTGTVLKQNSNNAFSTFTSHKRHMIKFRTQLESMRNPKEGSKGARPARMELLDAMCEHYDRYLECFKKEFASYLPANPDEAADATIEGKRKKPQDQVLAEKPEPEVDEIDEPEPEPKKKEPIASKRPVVPKPVEPEQPQVKKSKGELKNRLRRD